MITSNDYKKIIDLFGRCFLPRKIFPGFESKNREIKDFFSILGNKIKF